MHPQQPDTVTADTVTIDLSVPTLTPKQLSEIEAQCNAHIRAAHSIRQLVLDGSREGQAARQKVIDEGNLRGKLPPADVIQVTRLTAGNTALGHPCTAGLKITVLLSISMQHQCLQAPYVHILAIGESETRSHYICRLYRHGSDPLRTKLHQCQRAAAATAHVQVRAVRQLCNLQMIDCKP